MSHDTEQPPVGYKNPPQHSRFQKGRSGNPSGRRKAKPQLDLLAEFTKLVSETIQIKKKGKIQYVTMLEAFLRTTMDGELKGNAAARKEVFRLLDLMKEGASEETGEMTKEQEAQLLAGFFARGRRADGGCDD
ncbi:DUF5681 domain-containing protein [Bosea sp. 124]|uniref:DUF5681 domain-containing protein n=1 Tax=Bosea sp. 124 TaxID=2135642 RepID=UPI000D3BAB89|nr:DUF5681 domain-containing protein [Bosea sp. 124]PTM41708.1 hypothetical protein C8D03_3278 [Bosea sp. 124]